jgi:hypothetical protein
MVVWCWPRTQRKLEALQTSEALTDGGIGRNVEMSPLRVPEKIVHRVEGAFARIVRWVVVALVEGVKDVTIRRIGRMLLRLALIIWRRLMVILAAMHWVHGWFEVMSTRRVSCIKFVWLAQPSHRKTRHKRPGDSVYLSDC